MLEEFKRQFLMGRKFLLISFAFLIGLPILFGGIGMLVLEIIQGNTDSIKYGIMIVWMITLIVCGMIWSCEKIGNPFVRAVQMSAVRKTYIICYLFIGMIVVFLMFQTGNIQLMILSKIFGFQTEIPFFSIQECALGAVIVMLFGYWYGAVIIKYGRKSFLILGGIYFTSIANLWPGNASGRESLLHKFFGWLMQDISVESANIRKEGLFEKIIKFIVADDLGGQVQLHPYRWIVVISVLLIIFLIHGCFLLRRYAVSD